MSVVIVVLPQKYTKNQTTKTTMNNKNNQLFNNQSVLICLMICIDFPSVSEGSFLSDLAA